MAVEVRNLAIDCSTGGMTDDVKEGYAYVYCVR